MKTISYKTLRLENFKNFREYELDFSPMNTRIYGANATGKTTIADALSWVLFGKDSKGATQFAIKTHDENGVDYPNLDHSAELVIEVDGLLRTLKRALKEKWVKPRGQKELRFDGNYQELFIDGQLTSLQDYDNFISSIINEEVFRTITSTNYFLSKPWKERREFLLNMVGTISTDEVTQGDERFNNIINQMKKQSLTDYITHLRFTAKEVKKKLDLIPTRIEEQQKALPEVKDWNAYREQIKDVESHIDELNLKLQSTEEDLFSQNISHEITSIDNELSNIRTQIRTQIEQKRREINSVIDATRRERDNINNTIFDLQSKVKANTRLIEETERAQKKLDEKTLDIRKRWQENQESRLSIDESESICPFCHQSLPEDQVRDKVDKLKKDFNERRARITEGLRAEADKVKRDQAQAEEDIKSYKETIADANTEIAKLTSKAALLQSKIDGVEQVPTEQSLLENNTHYNNLIERRAQLIQQRDSAPTVESPKEAIRKQIQSLNQERDSLNRIIFSEQQYKKGLKLIEDIKKEQSTLSSQLAQLEEQDDLAVEYNKRHDEILEDKINAHFSFVKWSMFKTLVNGNKESCCEATNNGTDFYNMNSAAQIMAGLDICNAISCYYQITAPIVIDNAERINSKNILPTSGQQIQLYVSEDTQLVIR